MTRAHVYLVLAVVGAVLPWLGFARFFAVQGPGGDFLGALFVNGAAGGFAVDLLISSVVFWIFLFEAASRGRLDRPWVYILLNLIVGLSCALPLALWRIHARDDRARAGTAGRAGAIAGALLALGAGWTCAHAESPASASEPGQVVERFFTAYRDGDVDGMLALYTPDAVFVDVGQRYEYAGRDELRDFLRRLVRLHREMDVTVARMLAEGGRVAVEFAYTGTLSGEALHELTGNESCRDTDYRLPATSWFEIENGRIARQTDYLDMTTLAEVQRRASGASP